MGTGACALIPAAGRGVRFGKPRNKVLTPLLGQPVLGWTLAPFVTCDDIDCILLIGAAEDIDDLEQIAARYDGAKRIRVVRGGADRQASVRAGLAVADSEYIVVHDAARPCVTLDLILASLSAAREIGAATAGTPVTDTLVRAEPDGRVGNNVERDGLVAVQTPQAFRSDLLVEAHRRALDEGIVGTDDASLVSRCGYPVAIVPAPQSNLKITRQEDIALAEAILGSRQQHEERERMRVGFGYDVHQLADGRRMVLGGVEFPDSPRGPLGHSDADVLLHAVCDALLGAASLGDIGRLFANDDPRHRDRPSTEFLAEVAVKIKDAGYRVANIDITVIAEEPKIGPHAAKMQAIIAGVLKIMEKQVSIKATTNEGMGFVGRGEGIAAHAVALLTG